MVLTTFDRMLQKGYSEILELQLEARFGPLSPELREHLGSLPHQRLRDLLNAFPKAQSLQELGLGDEPH